MKVGMSVIFQNPGHARPDWEVYRDDLVLAHQAESMGYESIWTVEHHFTDYTVMPNPFQFLSYMAGRTTTVELGTMVTVLPWHDPVRVAEQAVLLDHLSGGRAILGVGRGVGRIEFEGLRIPMSESRDRFVECAQIVLNALEDGVLKLDGQYFQQPQRNLRPEPMKTWKGRTYAAAVSPESVDLMAQLGVGLMIIPQKPWEDCAKDLETYTARFLEINGTTPPPTNACAWTFVDEDPVRAEELGLEYTCKYYDSVLDHYEMAGSHFGDHKGMEFYEKASAAINEVGFDAAARGFSDLQVRGTPAQCIEKIDFIRSQVGAEHFVAVFSFSGMPLEETTRNMKLFTEKVMPTLKKMNAPVKVTV